MLSHRTHALLAPLFLGLVPQGDGGSMGEPGIPIERTPSRAGADEVVRLFEVRDLLQPRELYHPRPVSAEGLDGGLPGRPQELAEVGRRRFLSHLTTFVAPELRAGSEDRIRVTPNGTLFVSAPPGIQDRITRHLQAVRARTPVGGVIGSRIEVEVLTVRIDGSEAQGLVPGLGGQGVDGGGVADAGGTRLLSEAELEPWLGAMDEGRRGGAVEVLDRRFLSFSDGGEGEDSGLESLRYIADYEVRVGVHPYPDDYELVIPVIEDLVAGVVLEADGCILGDERVGLRFRARDRELLALREFETLHGPIALPEILERRFAADLILDAGQGALITSPAAAGGEPIRGVLIRATPVLAEAVPDRPGARSPR